MSALRELAAPFVVPGPAGVAVRDRLRVSDADAAVLTEVGVFLGSACSWGRRVPGVAGRG
ncbi:hypothetical protein GCM10010320_35410 [Streptomyces caelestis]|nr:hypothetical protein GCM10010320_35410 [Streptomyces caelestis]